MSRWRVGYNVGYNLVSSEVDLLFQNLSTTYNSDFWLAYHSWTQPAEAVVESQVRSWEAIRHYACGNTLGPYLSIHAYTPQHTYLNIHCDHTTIAVTILQSHNQQLSNPTTGTPWDSSVPAKSTSTAESTCKATSHASPQHHRFHTRQPQYSTCIATAPSLPHMKCNRQLRTTPGRSSWQLLYYAKSTLSHSNHIAIT